MIDLQQQQQQRLSSTASSSSSHNNVFLPFENFIIFFVDLFSKSRFHLISRNNSLLLWRSSISSFHKTPGIETEYEEPDCNQNENSCEILPQPFYPYNLPSYHSYRTYHTDLTSFDVKLTAYLVPGSQLTLTKDFATYIRKSGYKVHKNW
ncbi:DNA helicase [Trifolium repens]|nr:DNA helicase [Trifolium repens]